MSKKGLRKTSLFADTKLDEGEELRLPLISAQVFIFCL